MSDPDALVERYLACLGQSAEAPSADALARLHRAHALRFAHDTLWMARQRIPPLTPVGLVEALLAGEGGACLHLNGGLAWLLEQLGYRVTMHRARVQRAFETASDGRMESHIVLSVDAGGRPWYVDVGLGNGLLDPLPLTDGVVTQSPFTYRLAPSEELPGGWRFDHDRRLMALRSVEREGPASPFDAWVTAYRDDATSPTSIFTRYLTVNRRRPDGVSSMTGRTLMRVDPGGRSLHPVASAAEWEVVLRDEFLLGLPDWSTAERDALWERAGSPRPG